jgi:hypothetical protein
MVLEVNKLSDGDWILGMIPGLILGLIIVFTMLGGINPTVVEGFSIGDDYSVKQLICNNLSDFDYELPNGLVRDCMRMTQGEAREYWKELYMLSCNTVGC